MPIRGGRRNWSGERSVPITRPVSSTYRLPDARRSYTAGECRHSCPGLSAADKESRSYLFVDDFLHGFLPFDEQLLPRLLSAVGKSSALQIFLIQVSHVDKGHPPGVE